MPVLSMETLFGSGVWPTQRRFGSFFAQSPGPKLLLQLYLQERQGFVSAHMPALHVLAQKASRVQSGALLVWL